MEPVFALSIHADYKCRHSGVCCSSDWDVPVELPIYRRLDEALAAGRLRVATAPDDGPVLVTGDDLPDDAAAMLARNGRGDCVFLHGESGLCVVHRDCGESVLPATCRHFPRLAVRDRRGTFISLTHYCPTAASMLFREDVPVAIVESPPAFPPGDYEGLEITPEDWPPLLHPRMLMTFDDYSAWERHMVSRCVDPDAAPEDVIATLERDARILRGFIPGDGTLVDHIRRLPSGGVRGSVHRGLRWSLASRAEVMAAVPDDLRPPPDEEELEAVFVASVAPQWSRWHAPMTRYLAAKAFANWTAYQGRGLLSIVQGLGAALALVRVEAARGCRERREVLNESILREAFRAADFALNHLAVGEDLATAWSRVEDAA